MSRCSNTHFGDWFTCPECYHDHRDVRRPEELTRCEGCGAKIRCTVELVEEAVCELHDGDAEDDDLG